MATTSGAFCGFPRIPEWPWSSLNTFCIAVLAREQSWFDGPALVRIDFQGACFGAAGLIPGSRPAWPNWFLDDAEGNSASRLSLDSLLP